MNVSKNVNPPPIKHIYQHTYKAAQSNWETPGDLGAVPGRGLSGDMTLGLPVLLDSMESIAIFFCTVLTRGS